MLNWYKNYGLKIEINDNNLLDYIDKLKNINLNNNISTKIDILEESYINKINELKKICVNYDEYLNKFKLTSCLVIIQQELEIIKTLTKYTLENKILDLTFYIPCLNILLKLSEILRNKFNQKEIIHNLNNNTNTKNILYRCSYNFCNYKENCNFYYNNALKKKCYQDHYVHNMVSNDIKILLDYINNNKDINGIILYNKEVLKTINTLSFVINHMESELRNKCLHTPEKIIININNNNK